MVGELGRGSQGVVYLATDPQLERQVAIKTLQVDVSENGNKKKRLMQEARTVSKLQHPNIVPVYEAADHEGKPYLVFEYVEGVSLREIIKKKAPLEARQAVSLMAQILDGVSYAHKRGIVHRDLSPANILIAGNDVPRVMDFGISVMTGANRHPEGDFSGTICYMSPEHFSKAPLLPQSDIFSLGLILYEMLVGKPPVEAENHFATMYKIAHEPFVPPSQKNQTLDEKLDRIVLKALERDLGLRYSDALDMRRDLEDYLYPREEGQEEGQVDHHATVDFLLRRMRHKSDFPTFSQYIMEINKKASSGELNYTSASQLANAIVKDYALTNKLLRLVNSAFYGQFAGKVTTVSRAVVVLGFEQVRLAAASLMLFEHLKNKSQSVELKDSTLSSFMSGMIAKDLADRIGMKTTEEAFICGMLHNLGKHLAIFYFPEEYAQIKRRMAQKDVSESTACRAVLGISYEELGAGIARSWKFPDKIANSMKALPRGKVEKAKSEDETLLNLSNFSNDLCRIAGDKAGEDRDAAMDALLKRYGESLPVSRKQISGVLESAMDKLAQYSTVLKINLKKSPFLNNLSSLSRSSEEEPVVPVATEKREEVPSPEAYAAFEMKESPVEADEGRDPVSILMNGIQDITNTLLEDYQLNDVLTMILETMYRGFGFNRVLLCLMDMNRSRLQARLGFGKDIEKVMDVFEFRINVRSADVFNIALSQMKDLGIENALSPGIKRGIPEWFLASVAAPAFVLYPIIVNKRPIGLIYGDKEEAGPVLGGAHLKYMKTLTNQAVLAIKQIRQRG